MSLEQRKLILAIVLNMVKAYNAPPCVKQLFVGRDPVHLARRLEYVLYCKANSAQEYTNPLTLGRRLEFISLYASRHATAKTIKRKIDFEAIPPRKRLHSQVSTKQPSPFFHSGHQELTRHILGFLHNADIIRFGETNKHFTNGVLACIETIQLSTITLSRILQLESLHSFLSQFPRIRTLTLSCNLPLSVYA